VITGPSALNVYSNVNPTQITSAADAETDAALIKRCLGRWSTLGAGWTDQAFDYLIPTSD
jgi:hypothetical protein